MVCVPVLCCCWFCGVGCVCACIRLSTDRKLQQTPHTEIVTDRMEERAIRNAKRNALKGALRETSFAKAGQATWRTQVSKIKVIAARTDLNRQWKVASPNNTSLPQDHGRIRRNAHQILVRRRLERYILHRVIVSLKIGDEHLASPSPAGQAQAWFMSSEDNQETTIQLQEIEHQYRRRERKHDAEHIERFEKHQTDVLEGVVGNGKSKTETLNHQENNQKKATFS